MVFAFLILLAALVLAIVKVRRPTMLVILASLVLAMLIFWHHASDVLQIRW